jgi:hypothetical protein
VIWSQFLALLVRSKKIGRTQACLDPAKLDLKHIWVLSYLGLVAAKT